MGGSECRSEGGLHLLCGGGDLLRCGNFGHGGGMRARSVYLSDLVDCFLVLVGKVEHVVGGIPPGANVSRY